MATPYIGYVRYELGNFPAAAISIMAQFTLVSLRETVKKKILVFGNI
jgi:hypothetical protein